MPNWCNNNIEIVGPKNKVDALIEGAKKGEFLNTLFPMPQALEGTTADGSENKELLAKTGYSDWYGWRTANWSTKWDVDVYEGSIQEQEELFGKDDGDKRVIFGFDSAWSPPIGACEQYLENNNDMSIRLAYYEPGCDFMGVWEDFDDRCYTCSDYDSKSDFWETEDGELLDGYMNIVENLAQYEEEQEEEAANG
jgi:hypothetical protein